MSEGIQFPADAAGKVSTTAVNKKVWHDAVHGVDEALAQKVEAEDKWRFKVREKLRHASAL
jgi:hypothetical protein